MTQPLSPMPGALFYPFSTPPQSLLRWRWLKDNLIYLINQFGTSEVRRLRGNTPNNYEWNTDLYLDLRDG